MAMMPPKTASQTQSDPSLGNSKMTGSRREKLVNMKKREDLKDALTQRFKERFGRGSQERGSDEVSVCSTAIRREVDNFADTAAMTEANLNRLERRLQKQALQRDVETSSQACSRFFQLSSSSIRFLWYLVSSSACTSLFIRFSLT
mmetsp:Transcript_12557/g.18191  ORF Transcript_12557/g.18191 Transcript_12557/m.18191 type:complete len:146 (+) Transcript_12557:57-494(+)